ncbi:MAG: hypothetical protein ACRCX4_08740 [Bacteroidales bacterium]
MKMFKSALLLGGVIASFTLTSCLKGGNNASYTSIGTVLTDNFGNEAFYADNAAGAYRADNNILTGYTNRRIVCKLDINYDNQTSNEFVTGTFSEIKQLTEEATFNLTSVNDTLDMYKDTLLITPITSGTTVCLKNKKYYINLNINYLAQDKNNGPKHEFLIYNDVAETSKPENKDIYLFMVHDENGEIPGGKEMKTAMYSYDVSSLILDKEKKESGKIILTYYGSKGKTKIELPFTNFDFDQI